jgi:hypothetical protein
MTKIGEMNWKKYENQDLKVGMFVFGEEGIQFVGDINELKGLCDCCRLYSIKFYCDDWVEIWEKNFDSLKEYWSDKLLLESKKVVR